LLIPIGLITAKASLYVHGLAFIINWADCSNLLYILPRTQTILNRWVRKKKQSAITDVEGRRLREWRGLDTPVAWADNDECHRLALGGTINESGSTPPQE
jgi:hypothetical protein